MPRPGLPPIGRVLLLALHHGVVRMVRSVRAEERPRRRPFRVRPARMALPHGDDLPVRSDTPPPPLAAAVDEDDGLVSPAHSNSSSGSTASSSTVGSGSGSRTVIS